MTTIIRLSEWVGLGGMFLSAMSTEARADHVVLCMRYSYYCTFLIGIMHYQWLSSGMQVWLLTLTLLNQLNFIKSGEFGKS